MRNPKITVYTLAVNNYSPEICSVTFPYLRHYAEKIGAEFFVITERKFPEWPCGVEKFQIYDLARERGDEWAYFFDADALIHPDMFPLHPLISKDSVMHNSSDFAPHRWSYNNPYLLRDGRKIGSCNWFALMSEWCLDFYHPPQGITPEETISMIHPVHVENERSITAAHLCDDLIASLNLARYGLKFVTVRGLYEKMGAQEHGHFFHDFLIPEQLKPKVLKAKLAEWRLLEIPKIDKLPPEIEAALNQCPDLDVVPVK